MEKGYVSLVVTDAENGERLDKVLAARFEDLTRTFLQKLIKDGHVKVAGVPGKVGTKLKEGQKVEVKFPSPEPLVLKPMKMELDILYEDDDFLAINKPAGIAVHVGEGEAHKEDSLVNALLYHCKDSLSGIGGVMRPGIVHRLDKDTSGVLVVAKSDKAHQDLAKQFAGRSVEKKYMALVVGRLTPTKGRIESPIGRDPNHRKRMAVVDENKGKMAITKYEVVEYLRDYTLVSLNLITGRTHQIRVHMASIEHPLVGDALYGRSKVNKIFSSEHGLERQFLHAADITLKKPGRASEVMSFNAPMPEDLEKVLAALRG